MYTEVPVVPGTSSTRARRARTPHGGRHAPRTAPCTGLTLQPANRPAPYLAPDGDAFIRSVRRTERGLPRPHMHINAPIHALSTSSDSMHPARKSKGDIAEHMEKRNRLATHNQVAHGGSTAPHTSTHQLIRQSKRAAEQQSRGREVPYRPIAPINRATQIASGYAESPPQDTPASRSMKVDREKAHTHGWSVTAVLLKADGL